MSTAKPRVSVIIPTFNRAVMVRQSIDSVLTQSFGDLEVIVVDDGSTDDTRDVIEARYADDPRVRYVHQANGGPASAQNCGFRHARGDFVALNGDDDLWLPEKLALQIRELDQHPEAAMCFSDCVFKGGRWDGRKFFEVNKFKGDVSVWALVRCGFVPAGSVVMRRSCLDRVGMFDEDLEVAEDWDLWIRILARSPVVYVDRVLYVYRQHSGPQACDDYETMLRSKIKVLRKNQRLIEDSVEKGSAQHAALSRALRRRLNRECANHRGTQYKNMLRNETCPSRRELLSVLADSIRHRPYGLRHHRRFLTVLLLGPRFARWWYSRSRRLPAPALGALEGEPPVTRGPASSRRPSSSAGT